MHSDKQNCFVFKYFIKYQNEYQMILSHEVHKNFCDMMALRFRQIF